MKKTIQIFLILLIATTTAYSGKYNRKNWQHWIDIDKDGQNTRHEILIRDNIGTLIFKTKKNRRVVTGKWVCPYTGKTFYKASDMDISHIVPLKEAWRSGGANWSKSKKRDFANDSENLIAVDVNANKSKGDKCIYEWFPSNDSYTSKYYEKWFLIKTKYGLSFSKQEKNYIRLHDNYRYIEFTFNINKKPTKVSIIKIITRTGNQYIVSGYKYYISRGEISKLEPNGIVIKENFMIRDDNLNAITVERSVIFKLIDKSLKMTDDIYDNVPEDLKLKYNLYTLKLMKNGKYKEY